jgi:hypothetical protein
MKMMGAKDLSELGPRFVSIHSDPVMCLPSVLPLTSLTPQINTRMVERDIFDGDAGLDRSGLWTSSRAKL